MHGESAFYRKENETKNKNEADPEETQSVIADQQLPPVVHLLSGPCSWLAERLNATGSARVVGVVDWR